MANIKIEGLEIIEAAVDAWSNYRAEMNTIISRGYGKVPAKPEAKLEALEAQYPVAAAYRLAKSYERAANYNKSAAGSKAVVRIENGEDYKQVLVDMEAEWQASVTENMWN